MSYCLSINTYEGLVLCASSFVPAESNKSVASANMQRFIWPGNRFIAILSSGNQLTIDGVLSKVQQDLNKKSPINLLTANNLDEVTDYIADISAQKQHDLIKKHDASHQTYEANFIVSGQIHNQKMETLLIYTEGNYIHESSDSPYLQIGEMKFGKPILDRIITRETTLNTAAHCALVSVDSTARSNPAVNIKTELLLYNNNSLEINHHLILNHNGDFFSNMSHAWNEGISKALENLPQFYWEN